MAYAILLRWIAGCVAAAGLELHQLVLLLGCAARALAAHVCLGVLYVFIVCGLDTVGYGTPLLGWCAVWVPHSLFCAVRVFWGVGGGFHGEV